MATLSAATAVVWMVLNSPANLGTRRPKMTIHTATPMTNEPIPTGVTIDSPAAPLLSSLVDGDY
jgi:hypothetical protein